MGDFRDLHTNHVKERTCRSIQAAGFAPWYLDYCERADLLTQALSRYNNGRLKRTLCELFICEELPTLRAIMEEASTLSGDPKETAKPFQEIARAHIKNEKA
jgi:hypothetical protein